MTDKEYISLPRVWGIEVSDKLVVLNPVKSDIKISEPLLYFTNQGRDFSVEFRNITDYKASESGTIVEIDVINRDRRRFKGFARRSLVSSFKTT